MFIRVSKYLPNAIFILLPSINIPLCVADHCSKLFASMFPDLAIAKSLSVGGKNPTLLWKLLQRR